MTARRVLAAMAAVLVLGLAACSGSSSGSASGDGERERSAAADRDGDRDRDRSVSSSTTAPSTTAEPDRTTTSAERGHAGTVPGVPGEVTGPVPLDAPAEVGNGVEVRLSHIEAVEAEARLPGEIGGPAVAVTVEVANGSRDAIDLDNVIVDLATGADASAPPVLDPDREPLAGELGAGETRSGSYVFTLADEEREDVSVRVRYSADTPTLVFAGSVADG